MRVIAGSARGRPLRAPDGGGVRPTEDKVKGALFSLLEALAYKLGYQPDVDDAGRERFAAARAWPRVLDLYAGSGALGIEALSRGAAWVDFVESNARARRAILANLRSTSLADRAAVHALTAERAASTLTGSYDLILADPPYADARAAEVLADLAASPRVADRTVLIWEHHASLRPPAQLGGLRLWRTRRHGGTAVTLYAAPAVWEEAVKEQSAESSTGE